MRIFFIILIFIFSFQSWTKADNINELEIEGISIGSSLLDYISIKAIKIAEENPTYYKDNKYVTVFVKKELSIYDDLQVVYKPKDKK